MSRFAGYLAGWGGEEFPASPDSRLDGLWVRLYRDAPAEGFAEVEPGRHVRVVEAADCQEVVYRWTSCRWKGEPFQVLDEREDDALLVEYTGGMAPVARRLRLDRVERGVYRAWAPRSEVRQLRTETLPLR